MKKLIYIFQLLLVSLFLPSCDVDPFEAATDIMMTPVYHLHANNNLVIAKVDGAEIYNIYVYKELPKVTETEDYFGTGTRVYRTEDYVDNSTDEIFSFSFVRVNETTDYYGTVTQSRYKYVVRGYKDRTPYQIEGEDTPDDDSDDVYTRKELYLTIYDLDNGKLVFETPRAEDDYKNFVKTGLEIFETTRTTEKQ